MWGSHEDVVAKEKIMANLIMVKMDNFNVRIIEKKLEVLPSLFCEILKKGGP
jgi:hypothetical protein